MQRYRVLSVFALVASSAALVAQQFHAPVRIEAAGQPIRTDIGHSAPYTYDWDGDGVRDLLVGQFGEGKLRISRNLGSEAEPRFGEVAWFRAAGQIAKVPVS